MVRVPKLPLSITAVDSYTPSSISTTDMDVRMASLGSLFSCFASSQRLNHRPRCGYGHRSKLSGIEPGNHYRRPRDQAGPDMTRGNGARGTARTAPLCSHPNGWRTHLCYRAAG